MPRFLGGPAIVEPRRLGRALPELCPPPLVLECLVLFEVVLTKEAKKAIPEK